MEKIALLGNDHIEFLVEKNFAMLAPPLHHVIEDVVEMDDVRPVPVRVDSQTAIKIFKFFQLLEELERERTTYQLTQDEARVLREEKFDHFFNVEDEELMRIMEGAEYFCLDSVIESGTSIYEDRLSVDIRSLDGKGFAVPLKVARMVFPGLVMNDTLQVMIPSTVLSRILKYYMAKRTHDKSRLHASHANDLLGVLSKKLRLSFLSNCSTEEEHSEVKQAAEAACCKMVAAQSLEGAMAAEMKAVEQEIKNLPSPQRLNLYQEANALGLIELSRITFISIPHNKWNFQKR